MYDNFDLNFNTTTGNETEQVETNIALKPIANPKLVLSGSNTNPKILLIESQTVWHMH